MDFNKLTERVSKDVMKNLIEIGGAKAATDFATKGSLDPQLAKKVAKKTIKDGVKTKIIKPSGNLTNSPTEQKLWKNLGAENFQDFRNKTQFDTKARNFLSNKSKGNGKHTKKTPTSSYPNLPKRGISGLLPAPAGYKPTSVEGAKEVIRNNAAAKAGKTKPQSKLKKITKGVALGAGTAGAGAGAYHVYQHRYDRLDD